MTLIEWINSFFKRPTPVPVPVPSPGSVIQQLLIAHNNERAKHNLQPLKLSQTLNDIAIHYALIMARIQLCLHGLDNTTLSSRLIKAGYNYRFAGENIAYNYNDVPSVIAGWMASIGHKTNILNEDFTEIGFGLAYSTNNEPYWCVNFGTPSPFKAEVGRSVFLPGPLMR